MRIMGIDVGQKRIGLAISDEGGRIAFPFMTILGEGDLDKDAEKIREIAKKEGIGILVVGIPYSLRGRITPSTQYALSLAEKLRKMGFEVKELDERLTTKQAEKMLRETGKKREVDSVAASLLLQSYLERTE